MLLTKSAKYSALSCFLTAFVCRKSRPTMILVSFALTEVSRRATLAASCSLTDGGAAAASLLSLAGGVAVVLGASASFMSRAFPILEECPSHECVCRSPYCLANSSTSQRTLFKGCGMPFYQVKRIRSMALSRRPAWAGHHCSLVWLVQGFNVPVAQLDTVGLIDISNRSCVIIAIAALPEGTSVTSEQWRSLMVLARTL